MTPDPFPLRKIYFEAWQKALNKEILSPLETLIVDVIERHPEYHPLFQSQASFENFQEEKFALKHNPFFHLALHIAIIEQIQTDKPVGIRTIYTKLLKKYSDRTLVEHKMMACLAPILTQNFASSSNNNNEEAYLQALRTLT